VAVLFWFVNFGLSGACLRWWWWRWWWWCWGSITITLYIRAEEIGNPPGQHRTLKWRICLQGPGLVETPPSKCSTIDMQNNSKNSNLINSMTENVLVNNPANSAHGSFLMCHIYIASCLTKEGCASVNLVRPYYRHTHVEVGGICESHT
jgi:hypothetical protein